MNYFEIESSAELQTYLKKFDNKGHHIIALDIETENNLHSYGEQLCLIQIYDGLDCMIIDPLKIDSDSLKLFFENPKTLKVMYDAGSDLSLLKNAYSMEIKSILDLRPAVELLDYEKKDLHSIIAFELGITLVKKRMYQQYNWTRRPLSEQAINYALNDVIHLLLLKDIIFAKLYVKRLFEPFLLKNLQIQNKDYTRDPEDKYRNIGGYSRLNSANKSVFRRVFDIREKYAKQCNMPPHNVIRKSDVIKIVRDPDYLDRIRFIKRISVDTSQKILKDLRRAVKAD